MFADKRVSVVLPTYNEKDSIRKVIRDFEALGVVDEIIVINNNAAAGTSEQVAGTTAIEVHETVQGYGAAIQRGFRECTGDLIAVCEPDYTFVARDLLKLLYFSNDVEIVYGTRTVSNFIWAGANMGTFLRWGNWSVAKLIEVLFNANSLSDVGCTYRLIRRESLLKIQDKFRIKSNFFGPEMMIIGFQSGLRSVQIPVNYRGRVGTSSVTGDLVKAFKLGVQMILMIVSARCKLDSAMLPLIERIFQ
jgi:glycosyltransferase involved in cell wall biosynthesis